MENRPVDPKGWTPKKWKNREARQRARRITTDSTCVVRRLLLPPHRLHKSVFLITSCFHRVQRVRLHACGRRTHCSKPQVTLRDAMCKNTGRPPPLAYMSIPAQGRSFLPRLHCLENEVEYAIPSTDVPCTRRAIGVALQALCKCRLSNGFAEREKARAFLRAPSIPY